MGYSVHENLHVVRIQRAFLRIPNKLEETDNLILNVIEGEVLSPTFIRVVLDSAFTERPDERLARHEERARITREIENLTLAVAHGGDIPQLVGLLKKRERRLKAIDVKLVPKEEPSREALRLALEQRADDWRKTLRANARQGRLILMQLVGPLVIHASKRPSWVSARRPEGLLTGLVHMWRPQRDSQICGTCRCGFAPRFEGRSPLDAAVCLAREIVLSLPTGGVCGSSILAASWFGVRHDVRAPQRDGGKEKQ